MKAKHKNVTLSLPEDLLQKFRVYAASRNQSMTSLMQIAILKMLQEDPDYQAAHRRFVDRMRHNAMDLGTGGKITWTRDELHER